MKHSFSFLVLITAFLFSAIGCSTQKMAAVKDDAPGGQPVNLVPQEAPEYLIQPDDELDIKFFYNPELNETVTVRPDGKISLQLVDEVQAAGLAPARLDQILTDKYAHELRKPVIAVILRSFGNQRIYVGGEVNSQGLLDLRAGMTPLQAVFNAGGFKETAMPEGVIIIRKGADNRPIPIRVDLKNALYGNNPGANIQLQPQDIVYVPKTWIAKANKFVNQYIENLLLYRGIGVGFTYQVNRFR